MARFPKRIVDHSARVIAVYNGATGGTKNTVEYAEKQGVPVRKRLGISQKKALKRNAFLTFALAFIFSGVVYLTIIEKKNIIYNTIAAISMAAYTFYCVIASILNLIHLRRNRAVQKIMLRNCSLVYALRSLYGLERMMLGTFGGKAAGFIRVMEAASSAGAFIIIVLFSVNLLMLASKI